MIPHTSFFKWSQIPHYWHTWYLLLSKHKYQIPHFQYHIFWTYQIPHFANARYLIIKIMISITVILMPYTLLIFTIYPLPGNEACMHESKDQTSSPATDGFYINPPRFDLRIRDQTSTPKRKHPEQPIGGTKGSTSTSSNSFKTHEYTTPSSSNHSSSGNLIFQFLVSHLYLHCSYFI
jgi:hypothetical protein